MNSKELIGILILAIVVIFAIRSSPQGPQAFLGTRFGMSVSEVERVVNRELLTYGEYSVDPGNPGFLDFTILAGGIPLDREYSDRSTDFFMSRIILYGFPAGTAFSFFDNKLNNVSVYFDTSFGDTDFLLEHLKENLEKSYKFAEREESKYMPGAYSLKYKKDDVDADLWVNTTGQDKIVTLNIHYLSLRRAYEEELKQREEKAL